MRTSSKILLVLGLLLVAGAPALLGTVDASAPFGDVARFAVFFLKLMWGGCCVGAAVVVAFWGRTTSVGASTATRADSAEGNEFNWLLKGTPEYINFHSGTGLPG